jgi:hypothetical protein
VSDHQLDAVPEPGADLEYDLAREASGAGTTVSHDAEQSGEAVVTATPAYDGDYSGVYGTSVAPLPDGSYVTSSLCNFRSNGKPV